MKRSRRRLLLWVLSALGLALGAGALVGGRRVARLAHVGAGYVAKELCSCIFVAGRDLASCRSDLSPDSARVRASMLESGQGVRTWVPGLADRTARYLDGTGCTLQ